MNLVRHATLDTNTAHEFRGGRTPLVSQGEGGLEVDLSGSQTGWRIQQTSSRKQVQIEQMTENSVEIEWGASRPTQFTLTFRPITHFVFDFHPQFAGCPGQFEIQINALPDIPQPQGE